MKKILGLGVVALLVMALVAGGTWAYFNDVETSSGNVFTAGTLDVNLTGGTPIGDSVTGTFNAANWAPGNTTQGTLTIKNNGTIAMSPISINITFGTDITPGSTNGLTDNSSRPSTISGAPFGLLTDDFAQMIRISAATWNGTEIPALVGQNLTALRNGGNFNINGGNPLLAQGTGNLILTFTFNTSATNGAQGAKVTMNLTAIGQQAP